MVPWVVLSAGLLCSALLFGMFYALSTSRVRAVKLAKTIAKELHEREADMASAQHIAKFGNWLLEPASGTMSLSAETHRIFGLALGSPAVTYSDFLRLVHENDRPCFERVVSDAIESREDRELDHRIFWNDGIVRWVRTVARPTLRNEKLLVSGTSKDITDQKLSAARLQIEHRVTQLAASTDDLTHAMPDIIQAMASGFGCECGTYWGIEKDSVLLKCREYWSIDDSAIKAFLAISEKLSIPQGVEIPGRAWALMESVFVPDFASERSFSRSDAASKAGLRSAIAFPVKTATQFFGTIELFSRDTLQSEKGLQHLLDSLGSYMGQCFQRNQAEQALRHLVGHDPLTELSNRHFFNERLGHALSQAARHKRGVALIFVDLDRFKIVNDTLGHSAGDRVLQECAHRLMASLRDSDVISRLGGDEFVITLENLAQPRDAIAVAQKILSSLGRPFVVDQQEFQLSASVGISVYPEDGTDAEVLLQNADAAMYRAKGQGGNVYQFYSSEMNKHTFERVALESSLRHAIERNQLLLHYQPKLDMRSGRIIGVEALVRWQHPDLGLVSPVQFIPLAEETGLIVQIGEWVLTTACRQFRLWQELGVSPPRIAVNLSARQFLNEGFLRDTKRIIVASGMRAEDLEFEITESLVIQNPEHAVRLLTELKVLGSYLSIDDFGTGYSSLAYLKRFPIDCVKIDRSFIMDIPKEADDMALTRGIIALAHSLRMKVVAEGVETQEQSEFLAANECDEFQGFLLSKPLVGDELIKFLKNHVPKPYLTVVKPKNGNTIRTIGN
jgi:diguanylate cyclase (GGDEF)-like protein